MKKLISFILSVCICLTSTIMVGAEAEEIYLSELRIVYADTYDKAREKLDGTDFADYELLDANLNSKTDKTGVWLAYKTTTDIEEAITDISAMYMDGGYQEGNYQAIVEASRKEYLAMSEIYLSAVNYFAEAYEAGDFLAECAYRQLNLYCDDDDHGGERIGDLFLSGIDAPALATMFMEGNVYALKNIRFLLAQGVSYNESGLTYLETVGEMAALWEADNTCFEDYENYEEFNTLALLISANVTTFGEMFKTLAAVEEELNYEDDVLTDDEMNYVEYVAIANMLRETPYTDGKTLYDFCLDYSTDTSDLTPLYPMAAALNEGQAALTKVNHFYDVVRYSMSELPEELMDSDIAELEGEYGEEPFNIYSGVDRSIFDSTYAFTDAAQRADAYNESGFEELFNTGGQKFLFGLQIGGMALSAGVFFYAVYRTYHAIADKAIVEKAQSAAEALKTTVETAAESFANKNFFGGTIELGFEYNNYSQLIDGLMAKYITSSPAGALSFTDKLDIMNEYYLSSTKPGGSFMGFQDQFAFKVMKEEWDALQSKEGIFTAEEKAEKASKVALKNYNGFVTAGLYFASGVVMIISAVTLYLKVHNYYNPDYSDVPVALVDVKNTIDGDRYIKYDAVLEAVDKGDGKYIPADTNAYKAQRWISLYYTKSYEAGKPLLCDFSLSKDDHFAKEGSLGVHLFGEEICYNLNKYNFDSSSDSIYLSVKQSEKNKSAVEDVPDVVGTMVGTGYFFLAAGAGVVAGIGIILSAQMFKKKENEKKSDEEKEE